ncbi:MAG: DNA-binding protein [Phycisphaerales bacterium]|nr:MAG: DNA-binding protein [Phycisphaerales bacterium]
MNTQHHSNRFGPLLNYRQAAERLGVSERTLWALVARDELPTVRIGRSVKIDPVDLEAFIQRGKQKAQGGGAR